MAKVGIYIAREFFSHGQLYVAISRVGSPERLRFAVKKSRTGALEDTPNIVFHEVLLPQ